MNLAVDIGNSHIKAAVFENGLLVETFKTKQIGADFIKNIFDAYPGVIDKAILASVRENTAEVEDEIRRRVKQYIRFNPEVRVPIKNLYKTPQTLGCDRMAAAVGADAIYPDTNVLIVDMGTAITIDMVTDKGEFLGGNISPGVDMRFRALNEFTSNIPLYSLEGPTALIASGSEEAVRSGVVNGIHFELEGYLSRLEQEYAELKIIFTGGDGKLFAKRFKNTIFATYDLVVHGLNRILEYNAD